MSLFEILIKTQTKAAKLMIKAVYVPYAYLGTQGAYFLYAFDLVNNTFYIDDLDGPGREGRSSAINIIERITTAAYLQEMNHSHEIVRKILKGRNPKIYYFYHQNSTGLIIIDTVELKVIKNKDNEIVKFELPRWKKDSSEKYRQERDHGGLRTFI